MRKNMSGRSGILRRVCAFAIVLILSLQLLPGLSLAAGDEGSSWKTLDDSEKQASSGKAVENTYIFEVSCGTRRGGDSADNVLYFIISYKTVDNQKRTLAVDDYLRKDSFWLMDKEENGNSVLHSLVSKNGVNKMRSLQRAYLNNKLGALPKIADF